MDVFRSERTSKHVKLVYVALVGHADADTRISWPSRRLIAEETGLSVRSVETAIKDGEDIGLWKVDRDRKPGSKEHRVNIYHLLDHGRGFVADIDEWSTGGGASGAPRGARGAQEQDHQNKTSYADRGHSSERTPGAAVRGGGRARTPLRIAPEPAAVDDAKGGSRIVLGRPRDLYRRTIEDTRAYICRAAVAACRKAGRPLGKHAASPLMYHLRSHVTAGMTNHELVAHAEKQLNLAVDGDAIWAHVFDDHDRAPKAATPDTLDALHDELDFYYVGAESMIETMWHHGHHPSKIYNAVTKLAGVA